MSKNKNNILIAVLIVVAIYIISNSGEIFLFSITALELENKGIPYFIHNSLADENNLGDMIIKSNDIVFTCKSEIATLIPEQRQVHSEGKDIIQTVYVPSWKGSINAPDPRPECWRTSLDWGSDTFYFVHSQKHTLNKYVNSTFDASGSFVTFDIEKTSKENRDKQGNIVGSPIREWVTYYGVFKKPEDEKRLFWFEVDNSFLQLRWKNSSNLLKLGSSVNPTIIVKNDLVNGLKGELLVKLHKTKTKEERIITIPLTLDKDEKEYEINLPKETLGGLITEAKLSIDFLGVKIFSKHTLKRTFNVIPNLGNYSIDGSSIVEDKTEVIESPNNLIFSPKPLEKSTSKSFILIIFFMIILALLWKLKKNDATE